VRESLEEEANEPVEMLAGELGSEFFERLQQHSIDHCCISATSDLESLRGEV